MKRLLAASVLVAAAAVAVLIVSDGDDGSDRPSGEGGDGLERVVLSGSLARGYGSVAELADAAELVAIGRIVDSTTTAERISPDRDLETFQTVHDFAVAEALKGEVPPATIRVIQRGGRVGDTIREFEDDPIYEQGPTYILFLRYSAEDDLYSTVAVYQGRFVLEEGRVSSLSVVYPDRRIDDIRTEEMPLGEFKTLVAE